ncbi:hypothetical protein [Actinotalea sp. K2]|uniref:DoxX family protein n=1 Tax=Actinotalea sp. K2 TaxID=2939438 RepID=UPI002017BEED|nr:hypothetical protein [Actinotalea sp. K2]MCL3861328.1 hypothetical protein [Actinotalea sp. K2]
MPDLRVSPTAAQGRATALVALLATAGATHLVAPRAYASLIPRGLGDPRPWVIGSGVAELACAVAVAIPRTRRAGALATAALFVGVFPGNVTMALRARSGAGSALVRAVAWGRLPLQVPLVRWALRVAAEAPRAG